MRAEPGDAPSILDVLAWPPRCWCCNRTFGEDGVRQLPAYRHWLANRTGGGTSSFGICEECAEKRHACRRCGRLPGIETRDSWLLWTQSLRRGDEERLRAAGLDRLADDCEYCVVRGSLKRHDLFDSPLSKRVAFGLAVIVARHWGNPYYVSRKGTPVPEDEAEQVAQLAALVCESLDLRPGMLGKVIDEEALDPSFRRALGMYAQGFQGREYRMPPRLKDWVRRRNANELPRQRSNRPVWRHADSLIALILVYIANLAWVRDSGMKPTRNRETDPRKASCICDAVRIGLREAWEEDGAEAERSPKYTAIAKIWDKDTTEVQAETKPGDAEDGRTASDLARHRFDVLEAARELGDVLEACRRGGMDLSSFDRWRQRYETHGIAGLEDRAPIGGSHPQTTPPETVERIAALALKHPARGCDWLEAALTREGRPVSSVTIQKVLYNLGRGNRRDRWLALERAHVESIRELSAEQVAFVEKLNPCFRERHAESAAPGEILCASTLSLGRFEGMGRVWLHMVVDTWSAYAFGLLHASRGAGAAVAVLRDEVLPFYGGFGLPVRAILTDNRPEFCGAERHPYETFLDLNGIEHRRTEAGSARHHGFMERFKETVHREFGRTGTGAEHRASMEVLRAGFEAWLFRYNMERSHPGYPNYGRPPIESVEYL